MKFSPFKIALIYLIAGVCWIVVSDTLLARLLGTHLPTSPVITAVIIKGLVYILITSLLLYLLIRHYFGQLSRSQIAYRRLFEDNPCPMLAYDPKTLRILAANDAALYQYGYSRKEFLSLTFDRIRPKEDIPRLLEQIRSSKSNFNKTKMWRHLTKDGKLLYVNISAQNGLLDGKKVRWVLINDMTEVKKSEKLLKAALERYDFALRATKDIIWDWKKDRGRAILHGEVLEGFGYQISSVDINWFNDKIHPDDMQRFWAHVEQINKEANPFWSDQFRIKCADGAYKYVSVRGYNIYSEDKKTYRSIGAVQIIQTQKEYEQKIENQNQLLKEIAHMVSHDLRGPLASLKAMLFLIEQSKNIPTDMYQEIQGLTRSANELDIVIHGMMDKANKIYQEA